jgi:uncharacterized protein
MTQAHRYHSGELVAQTLAGLADQAEFSRGAIGETVPPAAVDFLAEQPMVVVGAADDRGRLWASLLTGAPGFVRASTPRTIDITAHVAASDPIAETLGRPGQIGMIAIEPETRRRMRINGRAEPTVTGLQISTDQVYANCPKYIQKRSPQGEPAPSPAAVATASPALSERQRAWVASADTFFVATRSGAGDADASHRGGNPGFVHVLGDTELVWPDYVGNAMMMTLGNLQQDPSAGLLFVDWEQGATLQLTGLATVDWDGAGQLPGAQRVIRFRIAHVVQTDHASPLAWSAPGYSRFNPALDALVTVGAGS